MAAPVVIIMGPPGAGKGTQAEILARRLGGAHLSSGQLLRASGDTEVESMMAAGRLVPSATVARLVTAALAKVPSDQPVVLDGFVREPSDIDWLEAELERLERPIEAVINLNVKETVAIDRNLKRGRTDDRLEAQTKRWELYEKEIPVLRHYHAAGLLHGVDGVGTIDEVAARVAEVLK